MVDTLRIMEKVDVLGNEPDVPTVVEVQGETAVALKLKQKALEVKYQISYTRHCDSCQALDENLVKAYSLVYFNFCTTIMQSI